MIFLLLWITWFVASGQKYNPIRATFGLGITNGIISYFEPSIRITDKFSLGYRSEGGSFLILLSNNNVHHYQISSDGVALQYYFYTHEDKHDLRLFTGLGFANYSYHPVNYGWSDDSCLGFFPRFGLDWWHLTACVDFNLINGFREYPSKPYPNSPQTSEMVNKSYLAIRAGFVIGGGKKKIKPQ